MKSIIHNLIMLSVALTVTWGTIAVAQIPSISITTGSDGKSRTFLAGELSLGADILPIDKKAFTCAPVQPLKKGDKIAARTAEDQAWSADTHSFKIGERNVTYPIMGMAKCSDGHFKTLFSATTTVKVDIKAGEIVHSDGFQIESKRAIKAGETIPTILVGDSPISIESEPQAKDGNDKPRPILTIFKDDAKKEDRALTLEAWGISKANAE